jgi:DNA polymerase III epsilon subunit-like protein
VISIELLRHYRALSQRSLTVVDVETTGRYAYAHRITELSVLSATPDGEITSSKLISSILKFAFLHLSATSPGSRRPCWMRLR